MARKCSIAGKEMKNGWVVLEGEMYIADEKDVLEYIKKVGYKDIEEAFDEGYIYWTQWIDEDIEEDDN